MDDALLRRYQNLQERLQAACDRAGRPRAEVTLVAVSKLHPAADIAALAHVGQVDFGENYVQEALQKQVAGAFHLLHSLDSRRLAEALERRLAEQNRRQPVLIEVNLAAEAQKSGLGAEDLPALADYVCESCPHLDLQGLMCLPPVFDAGDAARPYFARLRGLRDALRTRLGLPLPELSMGMSGDFAGAVAEGATLVRIGTDIFGPRPAKA